MKAFYICIGSCNLKWSLSKHPWLICNDLLSQKKTKKVCSLCIVNIFTLCLHSHTLNVCFLFGIRYEVMLGSSSHFWMEEKSIVSFPFMRRAFCSFNWMLPFFLVLRLRLLWSLAAFFSIVRETAPKKEKKKERAEEKRPLLIFCLEIQCAGYSGQLMNSFKKFIKGMKTMWTKAFGLAGRQFIN